MTIGYLKQTYIFDRAVLCVASMDIMYREMTTEPDPHEEQDMEEFENWVVEEDD